MSHGHPNTTLRIIALYKFAKAALVVLTGLGILNLLQPAFQIKLYEFIESLPQFFAPQTLHNWLDYLTNLSPIKIKWFGAVSFIYALLFTTEGVGLWAGWRWAEWLTVVMTASLIPLEAIELVRHLLWTRAAILIANLAILAYLIWLIRRERTSHSMINDGAPK